MKNSPTQRSLKYLRDLGYVAQVVEHWNYFAKIRQDLFGIIDIVAIHPDKSGVLGVQTTSATNLSARVQKSKLNKVLPIWIKAGNFFEVHGWGLKGKKGEKKTYQLGIRTLPLEELYLDTTP